MPPLHFGVANVGPSSAKLDTELKSLTVSIARPDEATGDISSRGQVEGDYSFVAAVKIRESLKRSIQNNIAQFLQSLSKGSLPKPAALATARAN